MVFALACVGFADTKTYNTGTMMGDVQDSCVPGDIRIVTIPQGNVTYFLTLTCGINKLNSRTNLTAGESWTNDLLNATVGCDIDQIEVNQGLSSGQNYNQTWLNGKVKANFYCSACTCPNVTANCTEPKDYDPTLLELKEQIAALDDYFNDQKAYADLNEKLSLAKGEIDDLNLRIKNVREESETLKFFSSILGVLLICLGAALAGPHINAWPFNKGK